jgi:hypothetical protein
MSENFQDLFNLSADDFKKETTSSSSSERYKPTAKDGKDNVYKSVIRFIPWWKDPKNKSIISKWNCWLVDPVSNSGKYVDCPSSVPGQKSILQDMYWKLKKSESVVEQDLAKTFSRKPTYASLIQVVKDDNNPALVGKIMVFTFGSKIHSKIMSEMQPEFGKPHISFDIFEGKPFLLNIKIVAGFNNYDDSKFLDQSLPLAVNGETVVKTNDSVKDLFEHLKQNSPNLEAYGFQEWTSETVDFVNTVIRNVVPKGKLVEASFKGAKETPAPQPKIDIPTPPPAPKQEIPDLGQSTQPKDSGKLNLEDIKFDDADLDDELYKNL